uniref:Uncharacterized protein n=1 Tax=Babesia bovis TaxID=5865 RepID=S6BF71_BABBO|nr:hypothetical protein [Babesia bovis]
MTIPFLQSPTRLLLPSDSTSFVALKMSIGWILFIVLVPLFTSTFVCSTSVLATNCKASSILLKGGYIAVNRLHFLSANSG